MLRVRLRGVRDHLRVCGAIGAVKRLTEPEQGSSPRVRSDRVADTIARKTDRIISACAGAISDLAYQRAMTAGHLPRVRSDPNRTEGMPRQQGIISACAERSVVFYWDLVRLDGAECLIRTLCGVVEWRCSRYLEWMLSIYVTRASRPRIWGVLVVAGFRKSSERSRALTRRVAPRMNVFLSIIGLIDDRDTITLWGRRYPLGAYPKVDGIRLINEATKGGAHVFHCFVAAY